MVEAEITCECQALQLPDLKLALTKGMVVYLDASKARESKDLQRAWRVKGVTLKYVQRFRERRSDSSPVAPPVPLPMGAFLEAKALPLPEVVDIEALAQRVVSLLVPQVEQLISQAMLGFQTVVAEGSRTTSLVQRGKVVVDEDIPVFIPSVIGRADLQASVDVVAAEGEGNGVSDALAALKAARRRIKSE